ncbi:ATP-binding protein [Labilibaculum sp. DW002]|uniref:histidine kinase n=1 Tax=Paralabilibaculum antarcticum TaxID=2912572 RepID=A0ABT5VSY5_9BACT|nr:PAS domain-containing sensor histidine kinase [Labilibaculum sp. DW002]MDE5417628.1 ATP-binding protein [Labilibaculum sp. DW002]
MINFNKILHINIRDKFVVAFITLSLLPIIIFGIWGIHSNLRLQREIATNDLNNELKEIKGELEHFFYGLEENIYFLTASNAFETFTQQYNREKGVQRHELVKSLLPEVLTFTRQKDMFYQIKLIDFEGEELFQVVQQNASYHLVPPIDLNQGGSRYYLYVAQQIEPNTATFSPAEIIPIKSSTPIQTICCIYHIQQSDFNGALIIHIKADSFYRIIESSKNLFPRKIMLVDDHGYYVYHSDYKDSWNKLSAFKEQSNLKVDYGQNFTKKIFLNVQDSIFDFDSILVGSARVFETDSEFEQKYNLLIAISKNVIFSEIRSQFFLFASLLSGFVLISFLLALLATKQFVHPIRNLIEKAKFISRGNYSSRVEVETHDEIADLARQFNVMAQSLEKREIEISMHQDMLKKKVKLRTSELETEKNKLQTILDNIPNGILMLDKNGFILSASSVLTTILDQPINGLVGTEYCDAIDCHQDLESGMLNQLFQTGEFKTAAWVHPKDNGEKKYLEHVLIPIYKNGIGESVLAIITDNTRKKNLQDKLIKSEKFAVTGELAVVIAHEVRNSLTSVSMILQLIQRNEELKDTESVEVALDSTKKLESVVNNLLVFARPPLPMKEKRDINQILDFCVKFVRHQMQKDKAEIQIHLDEQLPSLNVDENQVKEAIINLILNGFQAIENSGIIRVISRKEKLQEQMMDLQEINIHDERDFRVEVNEILISKGEEVICIEVEDNGVGIPQELIDRIFDPFFTTKRNGTGLGLPQVKRVANQHGGVLRVRSEYSKGTCFSIYLPIFKK